MKTASAYETDLGLPAGSVRVVTTNGGEEVFDGANAKIESECSLWALRCIVRRLGFDAAIDAGIAALAVNQQTAAWAQWNYAGDKISRSDFLVKQIRGWIGYNQRQMDVLFASAVAVEKLR